MSKQKENYSGLILKIDEFIRKYYLNKIVRGGLYLLTALLSGYVCVTIFEYYGNFSPFIRAVLFYSFILLQLATFLCFLLKPLLAYFNLGRRIDHQQASFIIGRHFPDVKDKLINTLQLNELAAQSPGDNAIIESAINQKTAELKPIRFHSAIRLQENRKYLRYVVPPLLVIALIAITAPYILSEGTERIIHYRKPFIKKAPFEFVILNKSLTALQGDDIVLKLKLIGNEVPEAVYIEDGLNTFKIKKENTVSFTHTFKNVQHSKTLRFVGGEYFSDPFKLEVLQRPLIVSTEIDIQYPAYLHKQDEKKSSITDLTVPAGTRLNYRLSAQNTAVLQLRQKQGNLLRIGRKDDSFFHFKLNAVESTSLALLSGETVKGRGAESTPLVNFRVNVIPDEAPTVTILERKDSLDRQMSFFIGQVNDDHGFKDLKLKYRVRDGARLMPLQSKAISIDKHAIQQSFFHAVTASDFNLKPGQELEFYFEVSDNDAVSGAKAGRTEVMHLRRPSEKEASRNAELSHQRAEEKLRQAIRTAREIESDAKRLNRDLLNEKELSFSQKKQVTDLLQKHRDLEQLIKETKAESEKNRQNKQDSDGDSKDDIDKQKQLEKLLDQVLDDKTLALLKSIEKLLSNNEKAGAQEEIRNMQSGSKTLQKELDRILELYKQLEFENTLSQAIDELKSAASGQKKLASEIAQSKRNRDQGLAGQQELSEGFQSTRDKLARLAEMNRELERSRTLAPTASEQQAIASAQLQSKNALAKADIARAQKEMEKAAAKMADLASSLEQSRESAHSSENRVSLRTLNEIIDNLLKSSFDQENLVKSSMGRRAGDPLLTSDSRTQMQIKENMKTIGDSLHSLSRVLPQIESTVNMEVGNTASSINAALEAMSDRRMNEASRHQQHAMTSMNNLALLLGEVREHLQKAMKNSSSKGKGQQQNLSELVRQQDQLNKNMQKARESLKQNGQESGKQQGKSGLSEKMAQMAREQHLIRHALEAFHRDLLRDGVKGLSYLQKLAKDMEQSETDLVNKKIQLATMDRQQDILTRLLEAEKSDRERELDDKRESRQGWDVNPATVPMLNQLKKIRARETDYLKTVPAGLNSFYQLKIGDYFRSLTSK